MWDPSSPPFVVDHGNGATLYIPSVFFSWAGDNLDEKLPLLRSTKALSQQTLRILKLLGERGHTAAHTDSGNEQEFFLVDRALYDRRPDLRLTGRTVMGAAPPKGQELDDQYFGDISGEWWCGEGGGTLPTHTHTRTHTRAHAHTHARASLQSAPSAACRRPRTSCGSWRFPSPPATARWRRASTRSRPSSRPPAWRRTRT